MITSVKKEFNTLSYMPIGQTRRNIRSLLARPTRIWISHTVANSTIPSATRFGSTMRTRFTARPCTMIISIRQPLLSGGCVCESVSAWCLPPSVLGKQARLHIAQRLFGRLVAANQIVLRGVKLAQVQRGNRRDGKVARVGAVQQIQKLRVAAFPPLVRMARRAQCKLP